MSEQPPVRTRIAPSPTGFPHIGTSYQVLFDYAYARKKQGQFVLRIEDTDRARLVEGAEEVIFNSLSWFGLDADEDPQKGGPYGPYRQSERLEIYKKYVQQLLDNGHAYYCFCTKERLEQMRKEQELKKLPPMYDKRCLTLSAEEVQKKLQDNLPHVIRMKIPENETIVVNDLLIGKVEFDSNLIDNQVLLKADGFPTYHLAVVVDDVLMKISHIFRGREWLPSTPKHILLYQYFGWELPQFIHLPVIINADGKGKLSKRHGHSSVDYYKKEGYLPEAILNYLSNIVWNHPQGKEIYSLQEFIDLFEIDQISSQGPRFDLVKLEWMNGEYIRAMSDEELTKRLQDFLVDHPSKDQIGPLVPLVKERIKKLSDFVPLTFFLFEEPEYDKQVFEKLKIADVLGTLHEIQKTLKDLPRPWKREQFEETFKQKAIDLQLSNLQMFQLIRLALSGQTVSPPLFECIEFLGEDKMLERVEKLIALYPQM